jgi:hypothetical protein
LVEQGAFFRHGKMRDIRGGDLGREGLVDVYPFAAGCGDPIMGTEGRHVFYFLQFWVVAETTPVEVLRPLPKRAGGDYEGRGCGGADQADKGPEGVFFWGFRVAGGLERDGH